MGTRTLYDKVTKKETAYVGRLQALSGDWCNHAYVFTASDNGSLDAELRNRLRLKMKDQSVDLALAMAERHQLEDLFVKTALRLTKAFDCLKKNQYDRALDVLGIKTKSANARKRYGRDYRKDQQAAAASGWLELQYGWTPFLYDLKGSIDAYAKAGAPIVGRVAVQKSIKTTVVEKTAKFNQTITRDAELRMKYVVYYSMSDPLVATFKQLGLTNPLSLAWEKLPYSFVVDWAFPIGNALSSLDATLGLTFDRGTKSVLSKVDTVGIRRATQWADLDAYTWVKEVADASVKYWSYDRSVITSFPSAGMPVFRNPINPTRVANAMALLYKTFKK